MRKVLSTFLLYEIYDFVPIRNELGSRASVKRLCMRSVGCTATIRFTAQSETFLSAITSAAHPCSYSTAKGANFLRINRPRREALH
jgi:hypothetical protein